VKKIFALAFSPKHYGSYLYGGVLPSFVPPVYDKSGAWSRVFTTRYISAVPLGATALGPIEVASAHGTFGAKFSNLHKGGEFSRGHRALRGLLHKVGAVLP
jgi:hypothetical protein